MYRGCMSLFRKYVFCSIFSIIFNIVAFLISLPFTAVLIVLLSIQFIVKWIILFICGTDKSSMFYGSGKEFLRNTELGWAEMSENSIMQAVLIFDSKLEVEIVREIISSRVLPMYPRLGYKLCALPYTANTVHCWIPDENFEIENHIFYDDYSLISECQLQNYMGKRIFEKLPMDKPPWELRILSCQGGSSFSDTIIILRIHQSLADAVTLIKILCTKLADTRAPYISTKERYRLSYYLRIVQACCIGPAIIVYRLFVTWFKKFWLKIDKTRDCSISWSTNISMCKVERIKQVTRCSYSCVMLSAASGAFRNLLQKSGIKHPPDIKVVLPVTIDKNQKYLPVAMNMPVSIEGAIPRLWQTKHQLKIMCKSYDPFITYIISSVLMPLCPSGFRSILNKISRKSAIIQFSSIGGPPTRLVIDGSPLKTIQTFMPSESDLGISISCITYAGQVCVSTIANSSLQEAGKLLLNYMEDQVEQMFLLLMNRTIPEDLGPEYFQNQMPNISHVISRELKNRMQIIQYELQQLNELITYSEDDMKHYTRLKCEYQHVFREMKKRKSERRKHRKRSLLLRGVNQVYNLFSFRGNRVILYSLPQNQNYQNGPDVSRNTETHNAQNCGLNNYVSLNNDNNLDEMQVPETNSNKNLSLRIVYGNEFTRSKTIIKNSCEIVCNTENCNNDNINNNSTSYIDMSSIIGSQIFRTIETATTADNNNNQFNENEKQIYKNFKIPIVRCYDRNIMPKFYTTEKKEQTSFLQLDANEHII